VGTASSHQPMECSSEIGLPMAHQPGPCDPGRISPPCFAASTRATSPGNAYNNDTTADVIPSPLPSRPVSARRRWNAPCTDETNALSKDDDGMNDSSSSAVPFRHFSDALAASPVAEKPGAVQDADLARQRPCRVSDLQARRSVL
jgi:hypothetical protein